MPNSNHSALQLKDTSPYVVQPIITTNLATSLPNSSVVIDSGIVLAGSSEPHLLKLYAGVVPTPGGLLRPLFLSILVRSAQILQ